MHACFALYPAFPPQPKSGLLTVPPPYGRGHQAIQRSVRLSVPWRSCLGHRHAGCLQFSYRRPPEMCGLRTRPRTDVDPPRFLQPSNCHRRREYNGAIPCSIFFRRPNTYDIRYDRKWDIDVRSKADYSSHQFFSIFYSCFSVYFTFSIIAVPLLYTHDLRVCLLHVVQ